MGILRQRLNWLTGSELALEFLSPRSWAPTAFVGAKLFRDGDYPAALELAYQTVIQ